MALKICSLVGADETTPLFELAVISDLYPYAEWGFLYSPRRQGSPGRYPSVARIERAFKELPSYVRLALHVCGEGVTDLLADEAVVASLVSRLAARGGRVQLNFNGVEVDRVWLREYLLAHPDIPFITAHNSRTAAITLSLAGVANHAVLFDNSLETGISPVVWQKAMPGANCGYAGGLGPETIEKVLPDIYAAAGHADFWISMSGKLRDQNDRFDVRAARNCLELVGFELLERLEMPKTHPRRRQCELIDLFDSGLTRENEAGAEFEMMLQHMVHVTENSLDPNVQDMRRKAENLLLRQGNVSLLRRGDAVAHPGGDGRKSH
jgi:hypothetical protein